MEKLVGKVTYVRIPKLGKSYEMLGLTCIFENKAKSVLHTYNQIPSNQFSYDLGRHQRKKNVFFRALPESPKPPPP